MLQKPIEVKFKWTRPCTLHINSKSPLYEHAGLGRQFSTMRVTYGLLRAILGVEKAGTLAYCNSSLHNDCLETLGVLSGIFYKC